MLFPFSLMDLMLALSQDRVHTLLWSDRLLDEWERVIVREQHRSAAAATAIAAAIRDYFPENRVPEARYKHPARRASLTWLSRTVPAHTPETRIAGLARMRTITESLEQVLAGDIAGFRDWHGATVARCVPASRVP